MSPRTRIDSRWIVRVLIESALVVGSILLALAVDEWAQDQEYAELANQSLGIFEREIVQNRARVADAAPYHGGIRDLLGQMRIEPSGVPLSRVMQAVDPPVLLNTAWATSLATGALTHMDFEVVSALSLTYSIQETFRERTQAERGRFTRSESLTPDQARARLEEAFEYVSELTQDESELMTVYDQALEVIGRHRIRDPDESPVPTSGPGDPSRGGS